MTYILFNILIAITWNDLPLIKAQVDQSATFEIANQTCFGCGDCSVYCVIEDKYTITVSSFLESQSDNNYGAKQIDDYSLITAWVEGVPNSGQGEWVEIHFDKLSSNNSEIQINGFYLFNGYRKSKESWERNARVKKMKMYINGEPQAIVEFEDSYQLQSVSFYAIELKNNLKIRLEILDIYPGSMYSDLAISELKLKGVHHH